MHVVEKSVVVSSSFLQHSFLRVFFCTFSCMLPNYSFLRPYYFFSSEKCGFSRGSVVEGRGSHLQTFILDFKKQPNIVELIKCQLAFLLEVVDSLRQVLHCPFE